jgi:hypothetical protein
MLTEWVQVVGYLRSKKALSSTHSTSPKVLLGMVADTYNVSYKEGGDGRIVVLGQCRHKKFIQNLSKNKSGYTCL